MKPFKSLVDVLDERVRVSPNRDFIRLPEATCSTSFAEFKSAVERLAQRLLQKGLCPGDRVAIVLDNGLEFATASIGCMLAGGIAVPLSPALTDHELRKCIEQSGSGIVLTERKYETRVSTNGSCLLFPDLQDSKLELADELKLPALRPEAPALLLYTSGTTGRQKGAILTHAGLMANAGSFCDYFRVTEDDTALCVIPLIHSNGFITALLAPLIAGCSVVIPRHFEAASLWSLIHAFQISWLSAVPSVISLLLRYADPRRPPPPGLRFIRTGSGPIPTRDVTEFENRFGVNLLVGYGITEASGVVTSNPLPPGQKKLGSVGVSIGPAEISILSDHDSSLPIDGVGEVALRGTTIFMGYLEGSEICRDPNDSEWLRTGDLGYLDSDGYLFITGRKKEMINVAGEKVLPREVEEIIMKIPEVEAAIVAGREHALLGEEVIAFVQLRDGGKIDERLIKEHCRRSLSEFKVPRLVRFVDSFPVGSTGKIMRKTLIDQLL